MKSDNYVNKLQIAKLFLKLGSIAFGGPAAHIAMMEDEVVTKRKWMTRQHFLDLIGATNIIPGPNSTEMTMHCGYEKGGWKGLIISGACFILPATVFTMVLAWLYKEYGKLPQIEPFIYGIKPAVIAVILSALHKLGKKALKNTTLGVLGLIILVSCLLGLNNVVAIFSCGLLGILIYLFKQRNNKLFSFAPALLLSINNFKIFLIFAKVGAILYGSGYVLFAYLDTELVNQGLLTKEQLMDAIAIGQFTPGPVLSTATFIGWQMNGFLGAICATVGVFLPSFIFVSILNPIIPKLRKSNLLSHFLDAINIGAVAIILAVTIDMAKYTLIDWRTGTLAILSIITVFFFKKVNTLFIILGASFIGYALTFF